jgi:hypothetical protein
MKKFLILLVGLGLMVTGCTKELVFGKDQPSPPISEIFRQGPDEIYEAAKVVLKNLEYKIDFDDKDRGFIKSGWVAAKADSHYLDLFDRQDYGTFSAYYQLEVRIKGSDAETEVEVAAPARCIARHITSSHRAEKKFLSKLKTEVRGSDLHMSNVKVTDK